MIKSKSIQLVECPRDAMQGWKDFIPTEKKVAYLNALLEVGFHTLDFGSFVSPKAIPQMADTTEVLKKLKIQNSKTKLLAIVANTRGAEDAVLHDEINYLGFPFSISPTFQLRNTNSTQIESLFRIDEIQELCIKNKKTLVVYLSMAFGNPYEDEYNAELLMNWADEMAKRDIEIISLADTVGVCTPEQIETALNKLIPKYPAIEFGVHLHSTNFNWKPKLEAALFNGCNRFDGALKGIGGCPMAQDDLVGNMDSEKMIQYFEEHQLLNNLNKEALAKSIVIANEIFQS